MQHIVFGISDVGRHEKIKENVLPVSVLSSFVLASVALPMIPRWAGPLAVAQARKPHPVTELAADIATSEPKIARSQTVTDSTTKSKRLKDVRNTSAPDVRRHEGDHTTSAKRSEEHTSELQSHS